MNNQPEGQLIRCPNPECYKVNKRGERRDQILGRVLDDGRLMVMRFVDGTTIVSSQTYQLICGCEYGFTISGTVVEQNIIPKVI